MLFAVVKNEIIGNKSFDDRCTRWIRVMINFVLSSLGKFAQTGTNVTTKRLKVKEKIINQIVVLTNSGRASQLSKDFVIKRSALVCNILFAQHVVDESCIILFESDRSAVGASPRSLKRVLTALAYLCTVAEQ
jgi:hypothetical protein